MADSPKTARQKLRVKREGIHNVFNPKTGKEMSKKDLAVLHTTSEKRASTLRKKKAEGALAKRKRLLTQ